MSDETGPQSPSGEAGGNHDADIALELPTLESSGRDPFLSWCGRHVALTVSLAGSTFLVLKLLAVSRLNINTALALLRTSSLTNVLGAAVLVVLPTLGILVTDLSLYWVALNLARGRGLAAPLIALLAVTAIQLYFAPWAIALIVLLLPLGVLLLFGSVAKPSVVWSRAKLDLARGARRIRRVAATIHDDGAKIDDEYSRLAQAAPEHARSGRRAY